jgi:hypothetical protein
VGYRARPETPLAVAFAAPCTHRLGRRSCPQDPRTFHGGQPSAGWMPPAASALDPIRGLSRRPEPYYQGELRTPWSADRNGDFGSPFLDLPIEQGTFQPLATLTNPSRIGCAPCHGDDFIETENGAVALPFPGPIPTTTGSLTPLGAPTNNPPVGCAPA